MEVSSSTRLFICNLSIVIVESECEENGKEDDRKERKMRRREEEELVDLPPLLLPFLVGTTSQKTYGLPYSHSLLS